MKNLSLFKSVQYQSAKTVSTGTLNTKLKRSLLVAGLFSLVGCSNIPYAIIDGSRSKVTDVNSSNVIITGIDGQMHFDMDATKNIEPGVHTIRLSSTRLSRRSGRQSHREIQIDAKPCKRYVVAAKHDGDKRFSHNFGKWNSYV